MSEVTVSIDGKEIKVSSDSTIYEAAKQVNINIPVLCHHQELEPRGACRICVVEVEGAKTLLPSCIHKVTDGMVVKTNTARVRKARKTIVELLLASHPDDCLSCERSGNCELQKIANDLGIREISYEKADKKLPKDETGVSLVRDPNKCILCGRCVEVCQEVQSVGALDFTDRGVNTLVAPAFEYGLGEVSCVNCGQCSAVCPVGASLRRIALKKFGTL